MKSGYPVLVAQMLVTLAACSGSVSGGKQVDVEPAGAQFPRQSTPWPAANPPASHPTKAEDLAQGKGLSQARAPEPAKEREHEKA